jgi:threonine aldolase
MLSSILSNASSFGDDVFSEDEPTNSLESYIGKLTGMGHAVFVLTGTMGNQIALRCLLQQPPYSVICDRRSHIFEYECGMASIFSQAQLIPVLPNVEKQAYMTLGNIIPNIVPDDGDTHGAPTKVIAIENTFWGKVTPVAEVRRIADFAKANGIKVHLDGARLWNACYSTSSAESSPAEAAATATALLREYCALVDSVSLCFSKTLGAPSGSILVAKTPEFIAKARHFRKALGGGMRQTGVLTAAARVAVDDIFLSGMHMPRVNALAKDLEETWLALGGEVQPGLSQDTNMVWLDLKRARVKDEEFVNLANEEGVKVFDGRIVTHHRKWRLYSLKCLNSHTVVHLFIFLPLSPLAA